MEGRDVRADRRRVRPAIEGLEGRQLLAAPTPELALFTATTKDSKGVTVSYEIQGGDLTRAVPLGIYRSADNTLSSDDIPLGSVMLAAPVVDDAGQSAIMAGSHTLTITLRDGLPPNPAHPYVIVAADPRHTLADGVDPEHAAASFRKHVVGVVTHSGMQSKGADHGPWWQRRMAAELASQGYDDVITFNWAFASRQAGSMIRQVPRLAAQLETAVRQFPAGDPVDVHTIGHSEGAILNSLALEQLAAAEPAAMEAGYVQVTMLDPHAASNGVRGQQYSVSHGLLGSIARHTIDRFQSTANDPPPFVPSNANSSDVFFQRTRWDQAQGGHYNIYNLWGQVPVHGSARYFDLTGPGVSHSGRFAVYDWYIVNVLPTLGQGAPFLKADTLTGELATPVIGATDRGYQHVDEHRVTYTGTAAPGSIVKLFAARTQVRDLTPVARTITGPNGHWQATTRPLYFGLYRVVARATAPAGPRSRPIHMRPTAWLGVVSVNPVTPGSRRGNRV